MSAIHDEEAKRLVQRFKDIAINQIFADWDYYHKACALICVDEIIKYLHKIDKGYDQVENIEHYQ